MNEATWIEKALITLLTIIVLVAINNLLWPNDCHAAPQIGVHFNQFRPTDPVPTGIDYAFIQTNNSPPGIDWHRVVRLSGAKHVILNAEGIDRNMLFTNLMYERDRYPWSVNSSFVYYEFPVYTLPPEDSDLAYSRLKMPIYPLYRTFLPQQIIDTMLARPASEIPGGFLEIGADDLNNIKVQQVASWIDYVASRGRRPVLLLPPGQAGPYVHNVISDLLYLRDNSRYFDACTVLFAVYNRDTTGVTFSRVQSAINVFKGNFK